MKAKRQFNIGGQLAVKLKLRRSRVVFSSRKIIAVVMVVAASLLVSSCKGESADGNSDVAAKVGSGEITLKQVDSVIKQQIDSSGGNVKFTPVELVAARLNVLDNLVQMEALFQKAQKENLVPDDNKITQEVEKRKREAALTEQQYQEQLKQAGLTEAEVRDKIRKELAINELRERERTRIVAATDAEVEQYYNEHKAEFKSVRGVDMSMIVSDPANNGAADDALGEGPAEQKIRSIHDQLKSGFDFATLASQRSEDPTSAMRAGNVGFASEDQLRQSFPSRPEIPQRLMAMSAGQYTEPFKEAGRWYIFKVNRKQEQEQDLTLADVRKNIIDTIAQQRQGVLLNALVMVAMNEAEVKNYLAERIVKDPKAIVEMRPSQLLEQSNAAANQPQQPQPRIENQNQGQAAPNLTRPAPANANARAGGNSNARPANSNANR
jgi:peptidyl-prolyl cis-trans isomerase SurA